MAHVEEVERDYVESEDEDFNPEAAQAGEEDVSSSSEDEHVDEKPKQRKAPGVPKRKVQFEDEELGSGDEATIQESKRKKRRKTKGNDEPSDHDESGGEGGLVKTRAQRRADTEQRKEFKRTNKGEVTIDVDALWSKLSSMPVSGSKAIEADDEGDAGLDTAEVVNELQTPLNDLGLPKENEDEFITIQHTYHFAGQTINEEKRVHRDSAEAKLHQASKIEKPPIGTTVQGAGSIATVLHKPLKRASMFEPNPTGEVKGVPLHKQRLRTPSRADVLAQQIRLDEEVKAAGGKAQKLNTVQKSKLDWATHVDAEGLKDELDVYGRSKQGYMAKMDFLQDVQGKRDVTERHARLQKA